MSSPLTALSPLDGRYASKARPLQAHFSEFALIRERVRVEIAWLKALAAEPGLRALPPFSAATVRELDALAEGFALTDAERIKAIEATTNHDVKAVEYFLRERFAGNAEVSAAVRVHPLRLHFRGHQQPLARAHGPRRARRGAAAAAIDRLIRRLQNLAQSHADLAMLARTHGQPATPTTLGKEMANVAARLKRARSKLAAVEMMGKINGATGNFNAHVAAAPAFDWPGFAKRFVEGLGIAYNPLTIQIEPHDAARRGVRCGPRG
jgi:adenylosuccinate lyase